MSADWWPHIALGLGGALGWAAILTHALRAPTRRLWPPRNPGVVTVIWSWGLTIAIYMGLIRLGLAEGNALGLSDVLRFAVGAPLTIAGSVLQSWGTASLGLKATSGWPAGGTYPAPRCANGPYRFTPHPQYIGQAMSFVGIALVAGGAWVWIIALTGCTALAYAAYVEGRHLRAPDAT